MKLTIRKTVLILITLTTPFELLLLSSCSESKQSSWNPLADEQIQQPELLATTKVQLTETLTISQYDDLFKKVAAENNLDWTLLSAIAYTESRFIPNRTSRAGAMGLMQIMPITARHFGYQASQAVNDSINVVLAAKVIKTIDASLKIKDINPDDKMKLILAGYNSGIGNLSRAIKKASADNANIKDWNVVKNYGRVNNTETRAYVDKVMTKWQQYKIMAS